jgi:hypothetical protein
MGSADWEQWNGVTTETRDNPRPVRAEAGPDTKDGLSGKKEQHQFRGASGPHALEAICCWVRREWAEE